MPVGGGPAVTIADSVGRYSWGDGDVIVADHTGGPATLRLVGDARDLTILDTTLKETNHTWPQVLPGGKAMLFTSLRGAPATGRLAAYTTADFALGIQWTRFSAELFLENAFDERAQLTRFQECGQCFDRPYIVTNTPRTIGVRVGTRF